MAPSTPVIAEPEIYGGIELNASCSFLLLFSDGLYQTLEDATGTEHVNRDIASMVAAEFGEQSTLSGVAQSVVDKVARMHHDTFIASTDHRKERCQQRDDITLLVRNFNYPMPNSVNSPGSNTLKYQSPGFAAASGGMQPLSLVIPNSPQQSTAGAPQLMIGQLMHPMYMLPTQTQSSTITSHMTFSSSNESSSGEISRPFGQTMQTGLPLNAEGKVEAYVDFTELNNVLNTLTEEEREKLELKPGYETIPEEQEQASASTPSTEDGETKMERSSTKDDEDLAGYEIVEKVTDSSSAA